MKFEEEMIELEQDEEEELFESKVEALIASLSGAFPLQEKNEVELHRLESLIQRRPFLLSNVNL